MKSKQTKQPYKHLVELMNAALPYVNSQAKINMEVFIKAGEFMDSFQSTNSPQLSACDVSREPLDLEALLLNLQSACNPKELELVNSMLNFVKTRKLYHTYQSMKDVLPQGDGSFNSGNSLLPIIEKILAGYQQNQERSST